MAAIGDVATGALVARAVDPPTRGHAASDSLCLNCGTRLLAPHCHACGQSGHVHRTLGAIGHEIAHGVFHFEGKIWRTLPLLIFRPGELTRRYVAGERVRFVAPLALFLFTVFLMFAAISAVAGGFGEDDAPARQAQLSKGTTEQIKRAQDELNRVTTARADVARRGGDTATLNRQATVLRATLTGLKAANGDADQADADIDVTTGWPKLEKGIAKAKKDPSLLIYKLQSSAYKFSWVLIPVSTPFVALLFLWRRRGLYDHAIFVTYSISFMMLLAIVLTLAGALGASDGWLAWPALLVPPAHMFVQLRGAYGLRRRSAAWRTAMLLVFAFVVLIAFTLALVVNGLTG